MIRYALLCANQHGFESWFRDSDSFDTLDRAGQLVCPDCGSTKVRKALMAPSVLSSRRRRPPTLADPVPAQTEAAAAPATMQAPPQPAALLSERERKLREMVRALHREIMDKADNVGWAFAAEARRIHEGEAEARSIVGQASRDEVEGLLEEGIPLLPVPVLPDDHN